MRQQLRLIVGVGISLFFLFWAFRLTGNLGNAIESIQHANYWFILPALVVYFAGVWLRAVRWRILLKPLKSIRISSVFSIIVIGYMANDVLPARLGELVRAYVLGEQEGIPKASTLATIVVERLFDGIAMLIFVALVGLVIPLNEQVANIFRLATLLFVIALVALFAAGSSRPRALALVHLCDHLLPEGGRGKLAPIADRFLFGLEILQSGRSAAAILAYSLGAWLCEATMYLFVALGFGLRLGFPAFMLTTAIANLGAMVPAAPGYVGTFDAFALAALALFHPDPSIAGAYVIVLHLVLLGPVTLLGFFYLWRANLSLRTLGQRASVPSTKGASS